MYGKILKKPRDLITRLTFFKNLLSCALCTGFHAGWMLSIVHYLIFSNLIVIFIPFASAFVCLMLDSLMDLIDNINNEIETKSKKGWNWYV